jgi:hypothetical protein
MTCLSSDMTKVSIFVGLRIFVKWFHNGMSGRETWGPVLWTFLHTLASVSDRRDIYLLWNNYLRLTATILPCDQCRFHMKQYVGSHIFVPKNWIKQTGAENAAQIQKWLFTFHNDVNQRLGKPLFPFSKMFPMPAPSRQQSIESLHTIYQRLLELWSSQKSLLGEWKRATNLLVQLVASGST